MIIKLFTTKDTSIFNDYNRDNRSGSIEANTGYAPFLSVYKNYDETSGSLFGDSYARSLLYFDTASYHVAMNYYNLSSGSISCSLKMFDMTHQETTPTSFDIYCHPISRSWDEGTGIDCDKFQDEGYCCWMSATSIQSWSLTGSDFIDSIYSVIHFDRGNEDLDVDITNVWNYWIASGNFGLLLKLTDTEEQNNVNYYKKLFYSRHTSQQIYWPYIELKINDVIQDRRGSLILGKSGSIYLYNIVDGALENLAATTVYVQLYDTIVSASMSYTSSIYTASLVSTGIYAASIYVLTTYTGSLIYDVWHSGSEQYMTGTVYLSRSVPSQNKDLAHLNLSLTNLKSEYKNNEYVRMDVFMRERQWNLNTFTSNVVKIPKMVIPETYYEIYDYMNNFIYITASSYTKLSFDNSGHYFNLPMSNFIPGFYEVYFKIHRGNTVEIYKDDNFRFKVVD